MGVLCIYIPLIGLHDYVCTWAADALYALHRLTMHCWFGAFPGITYNDSWNVVRQAARFYAKAVQENHVYSLCTTNLHTVASHLVDSELASGPLKHRKEFWIEVYIGVLKRVTVNKVQSEPERGQERAYSAIQGILRLEEICKANNIPCSGGSLFPEEDPCGTAYYRKYVVKPGSQLTKGLRSFADVTSDQACGALLQKLLEERHISASSYQLFRRAYIFGEESISTLQYNRKAYAKSSAFVLLKDQSTYGQVAFFAQIYQDSSKKCLQDVAVIYSYQLVEKRFHDVVAHLDKSVTTSVVVPVQNILGRVAVLFEEDGVCMKAVLVPRNIENDPKCEPLGLYREVHPTSAN